MTTHKKRIIVLHKSGANAHYSGLKHLAELHDYKIVYREFSVLSRMIKSVVKLDFQLFKKQWINLFTLIQLNFSKDEKIVLGIAPYDKAILNLNRIIKRHQLYYHTSWPIWDGSFFPKKKRVTSKVMRCWTDFIEKHNSGIFCVTQQARNALLENYVVEHEIHLVGHSFSSKDFYADQLRNTKNSTTFCYVGRLVEQKGILKLLDFFKNNRHLVLELMGDGPLTDQVIEHSKIYKNIVYHQKTTDKEKLNLLYNTSDYLLLFSHRTEKWQELFGMVLVEAMATGCVPIATSHVGPSEVITSNKNGYLFKEKDFLTGLEDLSLGQPDSKIRNSAIERAQDFEINEVAGYWKPVLETNKYD